MKATDERDSKNALDRRNILLGSTTLAAASALGTAAGVQKAIAQAQQAAPPGTKPNILVIMGDDIGWFNIGAYHQGIMSGKTPTSTSSPPTACASPIITPRRAAPPAALILSPASCHCAPD